MLKRVGADFSEASLPISQAHFPVPFAAGLEFNTPEHSHWNIVHIGMQLPESRQIYICGDNCMRGVVMTADEMDAGDRFGMVLLEDKDLMDSDLTEVTLQGIIGCIEKWQTRPKAVLVFPVCLHHFMGTDMDRVYEVLEAKYPDIFWLRCWMDPIMQKRGTTPDERERLEMTRPLYDLPADPAQVNLIGADTPLGSEQTNDFAALFARHGVQVNTTGACPDFEAYRKTGAAAVEVYVSPMARLAAEGVAARLNRPSFYLSAGWRDAEIEAALAPVAAHYDWDVSDFLKTRKTAAEKAVAAARTRVGRMPIAIDTVGVFRPLSLARFLIEAGFNVVRLYADGFFDEEKADFDWLRTHAPSVVVCSTLRPEMRRWPAPDEKVLAIGPRAAWFEKSRYFVQMVANGGLWGYGGRAALMQNMCDALDCPKDPKPVIGQKGWGCTCVL